MIVRTYGRRNRSLSGTLSDSSFNEIDEVVEDDATNFRDSLSQDSQQEICSTLPFSSQDSSHWSFDSEFFGLNSSFESERSKKKAKTAKNSIKDLVLSAATTTKTLMETQEYGEMMEHVDEVNFGIDGLRKGQPIRIRRASLLSLLSICGTSQRRRILRSQGMAKTIIDALMELSFDDSPSNLAAATLFYILTCDGQDDQTLDSPSSINFLLKLLRPSVSATTQVKAPTLGGKLLALRKDANVTKDTAKRLDSSSVSILLKVHEMLVSCKELKSSRGAEVDINRRELNPKWIALLTMEKACLSTVTLEDTSGTVRKSGGEFKERLREHGGLDAVFEVAASCHCVMEKWLERSSSASKSSDLESLLLLLKCLKIMENATFLSKDNQSHLLEMRRNLGSFGSAVTFTRLIVSIIKILSGCSLNKGSSDISVAGKSWSQSSDTDHACDLPLTTDLKVDSNGASFCPLSEKCSISERTSSEKSVGLSQRSQWLGNARLGVSRSSSETTAASTCDPCIKMRVGSSATSSCNWSDASLNGGASKTNNGSKIKNGFGKRANGPEDVRIDILNESEDPFAFDEGEIKPSKWDLMSGRRNPSQTQKSRSNHNEFDRESQSQLIISQQESSNGEPYHAKGSCSSAATEETANLLADCLLTAVKVLMNLTNDNPVGCQQIAACGGLETLSMLIAAHFPSFGSSSIFDFDDNDEHHLTDQELDFLVAILGLLVNLVEKDGRNRSRLAAITVRLPNSVVSEEESRRDVIPLLCSIFLANQGAGETAGEGKQIWNDEDVLLEGEKEAEKMIIEAYSALLLAFLSTESKTIRNAIADCLPEHNLAILVPVLERFVAFHLSLNMISPETHIAVSEVIESCRIR
ncbi:Wings apart-like protein, C-terminal [Dillenia turbinata]|uniref:Wings apart-like protein, C-terminal n=1 Tax=Dillenia turbinata TaxID=194707 RepID=A0AAN8ZF93_9MAGN